MACISRTKDIFILALNFMFTLRITMDMFIYKEGVPLGHQVLKVHIVNRAGNEMITWNFVGYLYDCRLTPDYFWGLFDLAVSQNSQAYPDFRYISHICMACLSS